MTDRPILFSAPMVSAILDGRKTQTRRIAKFVERAGDGWHVHGGGDGIWGIEANVVVKYGPDYAPFSIGDRLWVREAYYQRGSWAKVPGVTTKGGRQKWAFTPADDQIIFDAPSEFRKGRHVADPETVAWHKRLGRFMPRTASRLTLTVTDVRVELLQDAPPRDAMEEGCPFASSNGDPRAWFADLWDSINGKRDGASWADNPWVTAINFTAAQRNIDA